METNRDSDTRHVWKNNTYIHTSFFSHNFFCINIYIYIYIYMDTYRHTSEYTHLSWRSQKTVGTHNSQFQIAVLLSCIDFLVQFFFKLKKQNKTRELSKFCLTRLYNFSTTNSNPTQNNTKVWQRDRRTKKKEKKKERKKKERGWRRPSRRRRCCCRRRRW